MQRPSGTKNANPKGIGSPPSVANRALIPPNPPLCLEYPQKCGLGHLLMPTHAPLTLSPRALGVELLSCARRVDGWNEESFLSKRPTGICIHSKQLEIFLAQCGVCEDYFCGQLNGFTNAWPVIAACIQ